MSESEAPDATYARNAILAGQILGSGASQAEDVLSKTEGLSSSPIRFEPFRFLLVEVEAISTYAALPPAIDQTNPTSDEDAWDKTGRLRVEAERLDSTQRKQALRALKALSEALIKYAPLVRLLPEIESTWTDDGALMFEWQIGTRRLGLSFEKNADESSWFYVAVSPDSPVKMSGTIRSFKAEEVASRLLSTT